MRVNFEERGPCLCVRIEGDDSLDNTNSIEVKSAVVARVRPGLDVVLDMTGVRFIDSSGVGALISILKVLRHNGRRFALSAVSPPVMSVLEIIRLTSVFEIRATVEEAIAAFEAGVATP